MSLLRTRRGLLMGFVVLALVAAACGSKAAANEGASGAWRDYHHEPDHRPDRIHRRQRVQRWRRLRRWR